MNRAVGARLIIFCKPNTYFCEWHIRQVRMMLTAVVKTRHHEPCSSPASPGLNVQRVDGLGSAAKGGAAMILHGGRRDPAYESAVHWHNKYGLRPSGAALDPSHPLRVPMTLPDDGSPWAFDSDLSPSREASRRVGRRQRRAIPRALGADASPHATTADGGTSDAIGLAGQRECCQAMTVKAEPREGHRRPREGMVGGAGAKRVAAHRATNLDQRWCRGHTAAAHGRSTPWDRQVNNAVPSVRNGYRQPAPLSTRTPIYTSGGKWRTRCD